MKLHHQLITQRVHDARELDPPRRRALEADPEAERLLKENRALSLLREHVPAAPPWEEARAQLAAGAIPTKERPMTVISRLFTARPWYFRLGFALLLVLGLTALVLVLPIRHGLRPGTPAWADTPGFRLTLDLPSTGTKECESPELTAFNDVVKAWVAEIDAAHEAAKAAGQEVQEVKLKLLARCAVNQEAPGSMQASLTVVGATAEEMARLKQLLAEVPGLPAPTIEDATWLSDGEIDQPDGVAVQIDDDLLFVKFTKDATDDEIRQQIQDWFAKNHPGMEVEVGITHLENAGPHGERGLQIKLRIKPAEPPAEK